jgi:GH25 family lysozyme M1 (1,4-beta-N-acetylmuramidase)
MIQEFLYRKGLIDRPFGSQLGQKEPSDQEKMSALLVAGALDLQYPVIGGDFSRWQGKVDWPKVASQLYFAYIQSSYGAASIDSGFKINLAGVQKENMAWGLYHYLKPSADAKKTALLFYTVWKDSGSQLPPAFDIEQNDGLNQNALNGWMEKVLKTFNELAGREVLKVGYSSANFINTYVMKTPTYDWVKNLDWWIACWTTASDPLLPLVFKLFAKPKSWEWWQYSSKGVGSLYGVASPNLDLNRSRLPLNLFNGIYGVNLAVRPVTPPPPPPPPPPVDDDTPIDKMWCHTPDGINIRSGPGTQYPIVGALPYKGIVTPTQIGGSSAWIEIGPNKWVCVTLNTLRFMEKLSPEDQAYIDGPDQQES